MGSHVPATRPPPNFSGVKMENILSVVKSAKYNNLTIDLDDVFELAGYTTKGHAVRQLEKVCDEGKHFTVSTEATGAKPRRVYSLTYRGFQCFLASAQTSVGKAFREYIFDYIETLEQENAKLLEQKIFWMNCTIDGKNEHIRELESIRSEYQPIVNKWYDLERAKWERKQRRLYGY